MVPVVAPEATLAAHRGRRRAEGEDGRRVRPLNGRALSSCHVWLRRAGRVGDARCFGRPGGNLKCSGRSSRHGPPSVRRQAVYPHGGANVPSIEILRSRSQSICARSCSGPPDTLSRRPSRARSVSRPRPPESLSRPPPPSSSSDFAPPRRKSRPASPSRRSAPRPPTTTSLPLPAQILSRPPKPQMTSRPGRAAQGVRPTVADDGAPQPLAVHEDEAIAGARAGSGWSVTSVDFASPGRRRPTCRCPHRDGAPGTPVTPGI